MVKSTRLLIGIPLAFTMLVVWFAWTAFRAAPPLAAETLRGAGLSIAAAVEQLAVADPSFRSLARYTTPDIAYFALVDRQGTIRFHTNPGLIGKTSELPDRSHALSGILEQRELLGTGEEVYLLRTALHADHNEYLLVLALHTYRADQVIHRAQLGVSVVSALTAALWGLTLLAVFMLRRDEKRQREMQRQEELARLGEMGAVMAHEIRNPLAGIKGFAQLIEATDNLETARRHAGKVVSQSLRMEALVNDLLNYARNDVGERHPVDLSELVQECITLERSEAVGNNVDIEVNLTDRALVTGNADRLTQMLLNLIKNALQAMPQGGVMKLSLLERGNSIQLAVRDNGIGIPPEHRENIFNPFWTSKTTGTGLGLALCKKIAEEHGGTIAVTSVIGTGTEFLVTLPSRN